MNEFTTITIPRSTRNTVIGKIISVLIIGCLVGYFLGLDGAANFERGQKLTLEQYTAEFEQYKAKLMDPAPMWGYILLFVVLAPFCFVLYELLGKLLGLIVGRILNHMVLPDTERSQNGLQASSDDLATMVGKRGVTLSALRPSGAASFGERPISVIADGEFIPKGSQIEIVSVVGSRVVVRKVEESPDQQQEGKP